MKSCFKKRDAHPFFGEVILRERNIHEGNMLRQHYVEPPPKPKPLEKPNAPENKGFVPFSGKGNRLGSS